ncbi:metal-dependent hydrolase [Pontibacillus yanchengensis]|nr:metal-dependent hydrolase [Pontibacillus yanchengensis]MYL54411.1 metal-dependent hydrolase [Pontibacillus yanchengensis]
MVATSHQVMGFTWGMGAITIYNSVGYIPDQLFSTILFFAAVIIGSLIPDIDTPKSKLGGPFERWGFMFVICLVGVEILTPGFSRSAQFLLMILSPLLFVYSGHRKFTHSIAFLALMGAYSFLLHTYIAIPLFYLVGFLTGIVSHLFGDFLTKRGIPLFYPISRKHVKFFYTFRTGSPIEVSITAALVVLNIVILSKNVLG